MKFIFLVSLFLVSAQTLAQSVQCHCSEPNFRNEDRDMAVFNFMETKMGVETVNITSFNIIESEFFTPLSQIPLVEVLERLDSLDGMPSCERQCINEQNERSVAKLTYLDKDERDCSLMLTVEMTSSYFTNSFKSKVIKNSYPDCNL